MIEIYVNLITKENCGGGKGCKFFLKILVYKATDCSNTEQLSLALPFVDKTPTVREEFLGFLPWTHGLSG